MLNQDKETNIFYFTGKLLKRDFDEKLKERMAMITHYAQNHGTEFAKKFKIRYKENFKEFFKYVTPEYEYPKVSEDALQYLIDEIENVPFPPPKDYKFTFIDLFAGIGGFRIALQNLKGKCVFSSEWDKDAQKTYRVNFGEQPFGDITKEETKKFIPDNFDILCAGFPCQAFSIAGNQKGFSDKRGNLFFEIEKIIEKKRPKVIFLENVKNLKSHDNGNTFNIIMNTIEDKLKYRAYHIILNSMTHANVPQNRERIFIVAFDPNQVSNWRKFNFPNEIPLTKTIHDFIEKGEKDKSFYYDKTHNYYPELKRNMNSKNTIYQWRRIYVRENKSNVCPTLTANMGTGGHNVPLILDNFGIRKLTPKECFAFQGYPTDKYKLPNIANSKLYMQAGNSVTTPLIERITKQIVLVL